MTKAVKCQLALQGGGARLYAIVAALEALYRAEQENSLLVTRIAGTSAGAIAGGLYAAGIPPATLRTFLGRVDIRPVLQPPLWPLSTKGAWLSRVVRGNAAGSERALGDLLKAIMKENGVATDITLAGVKKLPPQKSLSIVATDTRGRKAKVFSTESTADERLLDVMMHSAALPFFFRNVPRTEQPLVLDGGLCMNLPADCLLPHVRDDGRIVAVTFRESLAEQPRSVLELGALLLDIAMHANVLKNRSAPQVTVLELDCGHVSTLDFNVAQRACRDVTPDYSAAQEQAARFFKTFAKAGSGQIVGSDFWDTPVALMDAVDRLYEARDAKQQFKHLRRSFHVTLEKPDDPQCPTLVRQEMDFVPGHTSVAMIAPQVSVDTPASIEAVWVRVEREDGSEIPVTLLPFRRPIPGTSAHAYAMLMIFAPMLEGDGRFTAKVEYWGRGLMQELVDKTKKSEDMTSSSPRALGPIDEYELGIIAPKGTLKTVRPNVAADLAPLVPVRRPAHVPLTHDAFVFRASNVDPAMAVSIQIELP